MVVNVMIVKMMIMNYTKNIETVVRRCSSKSVFLKIVQISQKTPVLEFLFNKVAGPKACDVIKNWLQHRCFPMKIANFLRTLPMAASENN